MIVYIHIGMDQCGAERIQSALDDKRNHLAEKGILYLSKPGRKNHTRLFMAALDPDHIDMLRWNRGYALAKSQAALAEGVRRDLASEIEAAKPKAVITSAIQYGTQLASRAEIERLRDFFAPYASEFRIIAHIDEQARLLPRVYGEQLLGGRTASLKIEQGIIGGGGNWREECLDLWPAIEPTANEFAEVQAPPFWLDYAALVASWEEVFGDGAVQLRPFDPEVFYGEGLADELRSAFDLPNLGKIAPGGQMQRFPDAFLTRAREMNGLFTKALRRGRIIPRVAWRRMLSELAVNGDAIAPGALSDISAHFHRDNNALADRHPALSHAFFTPAPEAEDWEEADPKRGYRASQYLCVFWPRIERITREEQDKRRERLEKMKALAKGGGPKISPEAEAIMPELAKANYAKLAMGRFAPHNKMGRVDETAQATDYAPIAPRDLPKGNSGRVIVGCMKNEAPYIVEWVAYHRAMGIDNILIYTNDCSDGTNEILLRLQDLGAVHFRNNDDWKGNSPQQYALNQSLKEPVIKNAEWIAHIDVDEFMNVRVGNGTMDDLFAAAPEATAFAMTWRLFGHNGVTEFRDDLVIGQFDHAAPKYCPKPHTVWGFKTLFMNNKAYDKLSCHRPNKLRDGARDRVNWVNGSGLPMGDEVKDKGWRSGVGTIGYDLIQLNHYALRSAESYLIKRQRGRALHVDRSIGLNYWVRMDWSDHQDITIQRNIARTRAEMDRLLADETLAAAHGAGVAWHRAKADELHQNPEFEDLYAQALRTKLTPMERVAYALALDMES